MKPFKNFTNITEDKKLTASAAVKMFKTNEDDWGSDIADQVYVKKGNLIFIDTFFYGEERAMDNLKKSWSSKGYYYEYFKKEYGAAVKIVDTFSELKARGRHKKFSTDGIVGVELKLN
jgi:hypothetical protein